MSKKFQKTVAFMLAVIMAMTLNLPSGTLGIFDLVKTANAADTTTYTALEGTTGYTNESYDKLVDGDTSTKWCCKFSSSTGAYIVFKSSEAGRVEGYTMTTGNDTASNTSRNPKDWTLYGCNDYTTTGTGTWEVIHQVTGDSILQNKNTTAYHFDCDLTAEEYQYFKLHITKNSGSEANIQLAEFSLDLVICEHNWVFSKSTPADCVTPAYDVYTCSLCESEKKEKTSEALGHTFEEKESHAPGCLTEGYVINECSVCHVEERVKTADPLGHDFSNGDGVCSVCGALDTAVSKPVVGEGTADNPYLISTMGELYWFAGLVNGTLEDVTQNKSAHAKLAADINLVKGLLNDDGTIKSTAITEWVPIGSLSNKYTGTFDGNGHTISGLYCAEGDYVGLFGYIGSGGKVVNTSVVDSYFSGNKYVGGVCGYNYYGVVEYCYADVTLKGLADNTYNGGIGYNYNSSTYIKNCLAAISIAKGSLGQHHGIGYNATNKYYVIKNNPDEVVLISAANYEESRESLTNGKLTYMINGSSSEDTVVWRQDLSAENSRPVPDGASENPSPIVYYKCLNTCAPIYTNSTEEASQTEHSYVDGICTNGCGVPEKSGNYYLIYNKDQLLTFAELAKACSSGNYIYGRLMDDIDLSSVEKWRPIGNIGSGDYYGTFDGNGHTISGIRCIAYKAGFIQNQEYGTTQNLKIVDSYFKGRLYCGTIAGSVYYGTITNCYSDAVVEGSADNTKVCGIAYCLYDSGATRNSFANVNISEKSLGVHYGVGDQYNNNCYYRVNSNPLGVTVKTGKAELAADEDLASGKITYLLNNESSSSSVVWRQTIGQDALPCLDASKPIVYALYKDSCVPVYTNDSALDGYSTTITHSYKDGICEYGCGIPEKIDGVYQIYDTAQLLTFADYCKDCSSSSNVNGKLMADIDLSSVENWVPIGNIKNEYYGSFDGNAHTISGINCINTYTGLFADNHGTIENLCISDSYFEGSSYVASIASENNMTLQNCRAEATLKGTSSSACVCGISCNYSSSRPSKNNLAMISIAEGSLGYHYGTNNLYIVNSYYLIVENKSSSAINSGDAVEISSDDLSSGKVTYLLNDSVADETSVWRQDLSAEDSLPVPGSTGPIVYGKYNNSCIASVYTNSTDLDGYGNTPIHNYVDGVCQNGCGELLFEDDTYLIYNGDQFLRFAQYFKEDNTINGKLMADIDMSNVENWNPIGLEGNVSYNGTFDGNGYSIRGINCEQQLYASIFYRNSSEIKNLSVIDSTFKAAWYCCGISAFNNGVIENCYTDVTLKGNGSSTDNCGIAYNFSTIKNCFSRIDRNGSKYGVTNPIGYKNVTNCYYILADNNTNVTVTADGAVEVSSDEIASGKVTYLLNGSSSADTVVWRQNLSAENSRPNPDSRGKIVYFGDDSYYNSIVTGDVNDDTVVDKVDAALVLKYVSGITNALDNASVADCNGDGTVDMLDVIEILGLAG